MIRILTSPPFLRFLRWGTASIVNSDHFQALIHLIATSPIPPQVAAVFQPGMIHNWGQFAESATLALLLAILWAIWCAITNPVATLTICWWTYESVTLVRQSTAWLRKQIRRWRRGAIELAKEEQALVTIDKAVVEQPPLQLPSAVPPTGQRATKPTERKQHPTSRRVKKGARS